MKSRFQVVVSVVVCGSGCSSELASVPSYEGPPATPGLGQSGAGAVGSVSDSSFSLGGPTSTVGNQGTENPASDAGLGFGRDAGQSMDSVDAGLPVMPAPEPLPVRDFGLTQRPLNTTCSARPRPTGESDDPFPQQLSGAGCMDPQDPRLPGPGLIPYGVNMPLWSDGATKQRWMALPEGTSIEVEANGNWIFPIGSVLVKTFTLDTILVETRLMMRHADGQWGGYSYAWQPGDTDAELLPSALRRVFGEQEWTYPSRDNCVQCHGDAPGGTLGPRDAQLDGLFAYPEAIAPQVETLIAIGALNSPLPEEGTLATFPAMDDEQASVAVKARAYLDVNCSHCHQPGGVEETIFDLRASTPLAEMRLCDVPPAHGNFGLFGGRLILPGNPEFSLLSVRMRSPISTVRMPQVGSSLVDEEAVELIDSWITNLVECNQ